MEASEKLRHLAAILTPGGAAAAHEWRLQQRREKRRAAAAAVAVAAHSMDWDAGGEEPGEEHEQQLRRQPVKGEPVQEEEEGQQQAAAGAASRHGGPSAVGRRLRVWLQLDSRQAAQQHEGRVAEFTPTGCVPAAASLGAVVLKPLARGSAQHRDHAVLLLCAGCCSALAASPCLAAPAAAVYDWPPCLSAHPAASIALCVDDE
jgi:hypothetical protein